MTETNNPKIFITGIPTAGKTYLARKIVKATGGFCLETDNLREEMVRDPRFGKWVDFLDEESEYEYYTSNTKTSGRESWKKSANTKAVGFRSNPKSRPISASH